MSAALPVIAIGMTVAGSVMTAQGARAQAKAAANAANYNAQIADRNAVIARDQAARDAEQQQRQARRQIGAARAAYGASGAGYSLDVLEQSAAEAEHDRLNILYKGELRAMGYTDAATLDRYSADTAIEQGRYRSASALLTGAGSAMSIGAGAWGGTRTAQTGYSLGDYNYNTGNLA